MAVETKSVASCLPTSFTAGSAVSPQPTATAAARKLKMIGLLGGMSWESSAVYYKLVNQLVAQRLGGLHSARCLLLSVDFGPIAAMQKAGEWELAACELADAAKALQNGGADLLVLCTNTMHKVADSIEKTITIPFLHIADVAGRAICARGIKRVLLLGTAFTMEQDFYRVRLHKRFQLDVVIPDEADRKEIHRVIYDELCKGTTDAKSRDRFLSIIRAHADAGVEGVILGCTEIGLLVKQEDLRIPVFDTTVLHAAAAVAFSLDDVEKPL